MQHCCSIIFTATTRFLFYNWHASTCSGCRPVAGCQGLDNLGVMESLLSMQSSRCSQRRVLVNEKRSQRALRTAPCCMHADLKLWHTTLMEDVHVLKGKSVPGGTENCSLLQISNHATLMEDVNVLKVSQSLVEGALEKTQSARSQAKIDAEIAQAMQGMQTKEIVILRHR